MVADEIADPVGAEFKLVYDRQNFGMPLHDALKGLAERVPILDARFFVTAVLTQRETGGNLSEVLDNLAGVIRERFKVKRQVRVVTAHGRITGWILAALPPALALVLCFVSPDHMTDADHAIRLAIQMIVVRRHDAGDWHADHPQTRQHPVLGASVMPIDLIVTLAAAFMFVALVAGYGTSALVSATSPDRRRLRQLATADRARPRVSTRGRPASRPSIRRLKRIPGVPKSPKEMGRLRRRLAQGGLHQHHGGRDLRDGHRSLTPCVLALAAMFAPRRRPAAGFWQCLAAAIGYLIPGLVLGTADRAAQAGDSRTACPMRSTCSSSASRRAAGWIRRSSRPSTSSDSLIRR